MIYDRLFSFVVKYVSYNGTGERKKRDKIDEFHQGATVSVILGYRRVREVMKGNGNERKRGK